MDALTVWVIEHMPPEKNSSDIIFEGSAGIYRSINLESGWGDDGSLISFGSDISSLGFTMVGDLMCSSFTHIIARGYAHSAEGTYHKHQVHLNEFRAELGQEKPVAADRVSLAESLDSSFIRQFG